MKLICLIFMLSLATNSLCATEETAPLTNHRSNRKIEIHHFELPLKYHENREQYYKEINQDLGGEWKDPAYVSEAVVSKWRSKAQKTNLSSLFILDKKVMFEYENGIISYAPYLTENLKVYTAFHHNRFVNEEKDINISSAQLHFDNHEKWVLLEAGFKKLDDLVPRVTFIRIFPELDLTKG